MSFIKWAVAIALIVFGFVLALAGLLLCLTIIGIPLGFPIALGGLALGGVGFGIIGRKDLDILELRRRRRVRAA